MAAFRRCFIVLAGLAAWAGLASAQVMTCSVTSQQGNINLRSESKAELVSDVLITCTSTGVITTTTAAPVVNMTITFNAPVTSKVLATTTSPAYSVSESLLLVDDPQSSTNAPVSGFGIGAAQVGCAFSNTTLNGCAAFPNIVGGVAVMSNTNAPEGTPTPGAPNVYQGVSSGNSLTFFGVPVIPPGTNSTRTYRITNVRVNANQAAGQVVGSVSVQAGAGPGPSGAGLFSFTQTVSPPLGTSTNSLSTKAFGAALSNCNAFSYTFAGSISFTELFNNAFKPRVVPTGAQFSGQANTTVQNLPGAFNGSSESDFVPSSGVVTQLGNSLSGTPGLADFGTRLKAVFSNIPSGERIFVSFVNVTGTNVVGSVNSTFFNTTFQPAAGNSATTSFAALLQPGSESAPDNWPAIAATAQLGTATTGSIPVGFPYFELTVSGGSATAVWEVLNSSSSATETFTFDIFITAAAQPVTGTASADLTYAPTTTTTVVPNFNDPGTTTAVYTVTQCQTVLLFPYVTSAAGFDTGIAVSNTSSDPFKTVAQTGTCTFNFYGSPATAATTSPAIPGGSAPYVFTVGGVTPGFSGYLIAQCNFQYAHGFAFVADWTSPMVSSAMGYLALIIPTTSPSRPAPETLDQ